MTKQLYSHQQKDFWMASMSDWTPANLFKEKRNSTRSSAANTGNFSENKELAKTIKKGVRGSSQSSAKNSLNATQKPPINVNLTIKTKRSVSSSYTRPQSAKEFSEQYSKQKESKVTTYDHYFSSSDGFTSTHNGESFPGNMERYMYLKSQPERDRDFRLAQTMNYNSRNGVMFGTQPRMGYREYMNNKMSSSAEGEVQEVERSPRDDYAAETIKNILQLERGPTEKKNKLYNLTTQIMQASHLSKSYIPAGKSNVQLPGATNIGQIPVRVQSAIMIQKFVRGWISRKRYQVKAQKILEYYQNKGQEKPYGESIDEQAIDLSLEFQAFDPKIETNIDPATLAKEENLRSLFSNPFYTTIRDAFIQNDNMELLIMANSHEHSAGHLKGYFDKQREQKRPLENHIKLQNFLGQSLQSYAEPHLPADIKGDKNSVISLFIKEKFNVIMKQPVAKADDDNLFTENLTVEQMFKKQQMSKRKDESKIEALRTLSKFRDHNKVKQQTASQAPASEQWAAQNTTKDQGSSRYNKDKIDEESIAYSQNFDEESEDASAISESINYAKDSFSRSAIKDSIKEESMPFTESHAQRSADGIEESIKASSFSASKSGHIKESIQESIMEVRSLRRQDSTKSIQEDFPAYDSPSDHGVKSSTKRKTSFGPDVNKSIDESLEEIYSEKFDSYEDSGNVVTPMKNNNLPAITKSILKRSTSAEKKLSLKFAPENETKTHKPAATPVAAHNIVKNSNDDFKKVSKFQVSSAQARDAPEIKIQNYSDDAAEVTSDYEFEENKHKSHIVLDLPPSRTADMLYMNFKRELNKMEYTEQLVEKANQLERNITTLYNRKEAEVFTQLYNSRNPQNPIVVAPMPIENGVATQILTKQAEMEKNIKDIASQLKLLTDNLLGDGSSNSSRRSRSIRTGKIEIKTRQRKPLETVSVQVEAKDKKETPKPIVEVIKKEEKKIEVKPEVQKTKQEPKASFEKKINSPFEEEIIGSEEFVEDVGEDFAPISEDSDDNRGMSRFDRNKKLLEKPVEKPAEVVKAKPAVTNPFKFSSNKPLFTKPKEEEEQPVISDVEEDIPTLKKEEIPEPKVELKKEEVPASKPFSFTKKRDLKLPFAVSKNAETKPVETKPAPEPEPKKKLSSDIEEEIGEEIGEDIVEDLKVLVRSTSRTLIKSPYKKKELQAFQFPVTATTSVAPKPDGNESEEYAESFEQISSESNESPKLKPSTQPTPVVTKTEKLTLPDFLSKKEPVEQKSPEESIIESVVDFAEEEFELPSDRPTTNKFEPKTVSPKKEELKLPEEPAKEKDEEEEYYGEEFEEEIEEEELKEEIEDIQEASELKITSQTTEEDEADILASKDNDDISWQEESIVESEESLKAKEQERKEETANRLTDELVAIVMKELASQPLFPKRDLAQLHQIEEGLVQVDRSNLAHQHEEQLVAKFPPVPQLQQLEEFQSSVEVRERKFANHRSYVEREVSKLVQRIKNADNKTLALILLHHANAGPDAQLSIFDKKPINDQSIIDSYQEILSKLVISEYRDMVNKKMTASEIEAKMGLKVSSLTDKAKTLLLKRVGKANKEGENLYSDLRPNFHDVYNFAEIKRAVDEENDFFEEDHDIACNIAEACEKFKEELSDDVMEHLFEDVVNDLEFIKDRRKSLHARALELNL